MNLLLIDLEMNFRSFVMWVIFNCARKKMGFEWYEVLILGIYVVLI